MRINAYAKGLLIVNGRVGGKMSSLWDIYAFFYDGLGKHFIPYQDLNLKIANGFDSFYNADDNGPGDKTIVEIGCGTADHLIELGRRGYNVVGIDNSDAMLKRAEKKRKKLGLNNLHLIRADLEKDAIPIKSECVNGVLSCHFLYTLRDASNALGEAYRITRPSGKIVFSELRREMDIKEVLRESRERGGTKEAMKDFINLFGIGACNIAIGLKQKYGDFNYWPKEEDLEEAIYGSGFRVDGTFEKTYTIDLDYFGTATKPAYEKMVGNIRVISADTEPDRDLSHRLRHRIYCEDPVPEKNFKPPSEDGRERDKYDDTATHFIALNRDNGIMGSARAIRYPNKLPMAEGFDIERFMKEQGISEAIEYSRVISDKPYRHNGVFLALAISMYDFARKQGVEDLFASTREDTLELYKKLGFDEIGKPFVYSLQGEYYPIHINLNEVQKTYRKDERFEKSRPMLAMIERSVQ